MMIIVYNDQLRLPSAHADEGRQDQKVQTESGGAVESHALQVQDKISVLHTDCEGRAPLRDVQPPVAQARHCEETHDKAIACQESRTQPGNPAQETFLPGGALLARRPVLHARAPV